MSITIQDKQEYMQTLDKLKGYVENKINLKNAPVVDNQGINLASQPEVVSDHLAEETVLSPAEATMNQVPSETAVMETTTSEVAMQPLPQEPVPMPEPTPVAAPAVETPPVVETMPTVEPMPAVDQMVQEVQQAVDTSQPQEAMPQTVAEEQIITPQPMPEEVVTETIQEGSVEPMPEQPAEMQVAQAATEPDPYSLPEVELPPVIDPANDQEPQAYVATSSSAEAIQPSAEETVINQDPVIMPLGSTEEIANSDTMVVTSESFNMSR